MGNLFCLIENGLLSYCYRDFYDNCDITIVKMLPFYIQI